LAYHHGDLRTALIEAADGIIAEGGIEAFSLRTAAQRQACHRELRRITSGARKDSSPKWLFERLNGLIVTLRKSRTRTMSLRTYAD
jgi:hypothetical protein